MKLFIKTLLLLVLSFSLSNCHTDNVKVFTPREVYRSALLVITQIAGNSFVHTSYKQTNDFGNVPCNGLVVTNNNEAIVFDTPTNDSAAAELIGRIQQLLGCRVKAVIPTHFHDDCLGGLQAFHAAGIPSYAYYLTTELARENRYTVPQNSFRDSLLLQADKQPVTAMFFGEGHTRDNIVGYFPSDKVLFGGCLLKELNANKGYLGDANITAWAATVEKVKQHYPEVKIVVPGHGAYGNASLLDYTIRLFSKP
jgi:metallo-beta-lactamase class B